MQKLWKVTSFEGGEVLTFVRANDQRQASAQLEGKFPGKVKVVQAEGRIYLTPGETIQEVFVPFLAAVKAKTPRTQEELRWAIKSTGALYEECGRVSVSEAWAHNMSDRCEAELSSEAPS